MWQQGRRAQRPFRSAAQPTAAGRSGCGSACRLGVYLGSDREGAEGFAGSIAGQAAYTVSEAAELTKLSEWTVRNACNKGRIKAEKSPDGQWRIPRDVLVKIQNEGLPK